MSEFAEFGDPASDANRAHSPATQRTLANYESTSTLVRVLTSLMVVHLLVTVASMGSNFMQLEMLQRAQGGIAVGEDEANFNDVRQLAMVVVFYLVYLPLAIIFLRWIYRANRNAQALVGEPLTHSPGWSVGWFFVPIMNLFRPYQAMKEVWQASDPAAVEWRKATVAPIVGWWWALWIIEGIASRVVSRLSLRAEEIDEIANATLGDMGCELVEIPLTIVALFMVRSIYKMQDEKSQGTSVAAAYESCPDCGESLPSFRTVCPVCGHRLTTRAPDPAFE